VLCRTLASPHRHHAGPCREEEDRGRETYTKKGQKTSKKRHRGEEAGSPRAPRALVLDGAQGLRRQARPLWRGLPLGPLRCLLRGQRGQENLGLAALTWTRWRMRGLMCSAWGGAVPEGEAGRRGVLGGQALDKAGEECDASGDRGVPHGHPVSPALAPADPVLTPSDPSCILLTEGEGVGTAGEVPALADVAMEVGTEVEVGVGLEAEGEGVETAREVPALADAVVGSENSGGGGSGDGGRGAGV